MAYERRIVHLDTDAVTVKQTLSVSSDNDSRVIKARFELLRKGGCASGEITLRDVFTLRGDIAISDWIRFDFESGVPWYLGRVESVTEKSPNETIVALYGMGVELTEVFPGGFGGANLNKPHRYARSDWFANDPDHGLNTFDIVSQPQEVVAKLFSQYIQPATSINTTTIEAPSPLTGLESILFRGEESSAQAIQALAMSANNGSWGVDANRDLFFLKQKADVLAEFQEGLNLEGLSRTTDRSLLYNSMVFTGGYVYGINNGPGFYRYIAVWKHFGSIAQHGERVIAIYIPWIRRNADSKKFATEFFRLYAQPSERITFRTSGQTTLLKPWEGLIRIKDASGSTMRLAGFEKIDVDFGHVPKFTLTLGPEELQYPIPNEAQRFEIAPESRGDGETALGPTVSEFVTYSDPDSDSA